MENDRPVEPVDIDQARAALVAAIGKLLDSVEPADRLKMLAALQPAARAVYEDSVTAGILGELD